VCIYYVDGAFPRVKHLILADPWGFPEKPADIAQMYKLPLWVRAIVYVTQPLNPFWALRAAGPFGEH
jgi:abhydrolase domain-containing protein 5